ncbi:EamA family transporter [Salinilacihabitans rarus]|uniref:EamA family transporter n=1 Tax=Salinilacihabitans rarus TaxID=2961596 RepID=UPI0020C931CE|nr:EamA family transporter [Salinilacihabitans rarus]
MTSAPVEVIAFALVPAILWGFTPILDKRGMAAGGTSLQASLVLVCVDSTLYWILIATLRGGSAFSGLTTEALAAFVFAGAIGSSIGRIVIFVGVDRVGASLNSAILSSRPLFATLIALVWLGEPLGPVTAVGVVVLVAGLATLAVSKGGDLGGWEPRDLVWPILAAAFFALANVARRYGLTGASVSALEAVAINETTGLAVLVGYLAVTRGRDALRVPRESYTYFAGSGLLTTVAMVALMTALGLEDGRIALVDPLVATAPLFTVVFAAVLLRDVERVTRGVVAGAALIVVGAALITL